MVRLEILNGDDSGRVCELRPGRNLLGRTHECDVVVIDSSVSRAHAELYPGDDGVRVRDLGSGNGTFIQGRRITAEATAATGHEVRFGTIRARVVLMNDQNAASDAAPAEPVAASSTDTAGSDELTARVQRMREVYPRIEHEFGKAVIGQRTVLEQLLTALAAGGHCLMVGLPGLAKTLMVRTLGHILNLEFRRIQFTPDLMPSDILGTEVLETDETTGRKLFRFLKGPVFTNLLLADEINRTPPKTQSALLECMQEHQVTVANQMFPLSPPFFVLATQNPLEQEGTYPLPEAQLDRFMFNIKVEYPSESEEEQIIATTTRQQNSEFEELLGAEELIELQGIVRDLPASRHVIRYATRLARATRPGSDIAPPFIREHVYCGAGPRAAQYMVLGAKARAVLHGRLNVSCEDVRSQALPVLRHRLFTNFTADSEGISTDDLIRRLLLAVEEPQAEEYARS